MITQIREFFFSNVTPLVQLGKKKILTFEDLLEIPAEIKIDKNQDSPLINLESNNNFFKTILVEQKHYLKRAWSFYFVGTMASLSSPFFINQFISRLSLLSEGKIEALSLLPTAIGLGSIGILMGIGYQHNFYATLRAHVKITNRLNQLIFEKSLRLSQEARQNSNVGDVVNHMSSDTYAIADTPILLGDLGWSFLLLIGSLVMLFYYLGMTGFIAICLLGILTPITHMMVKNFLHLEDEMMKKRDLRVNLMGQILQSMRLIKYFVWEEEIINQIGKVRAEEIKARRSLAKTELLSGLSFVAVSTLVLFTALWIHLMRGLELTPALVLTCVSLFGLLQEPIAHLPGVLSRLTNAWVSVGRIRNFLLLKEVKTKNNLSIEQSDFDIIFSNVNYEAPQSQFKIQDCTFKIKKGASVAVVGEVGSGKTTLLQLILNEYDPVAGEIEVNSAKISYASQESYIFNGSIAENIKLGFSEIEGDLELKEKIQDALYHAMLLTDINQFQGGIETEIGERGVNLSGGQKQRLSLARCYFHNPDLVLLDDPLSAVDIHTEEILNERLIFGAWKNKTRVVVTHRLQNLHKYDQVIFIKDGTIIGINCIDVLLDESPEFKVFYSHYAIEAKDKPLLPVNNVENDNFKNQNTKIISVEDQESGSVKSSLYFDYIKALGGKGRYKKLIMLALIFGVIAITAFPLINQWWLSWFTSHSKIITPKNGVLTYGLISFLSLLIQMGNQLFWLKRGIQAGVELHDQMLKSVLHAPVRFFDTTPVGRLLQRFSRDLESIDIQLQWNFESALQSFFQVVISLTLIIASVPFILVIIFPVGLMYWQFQIGYRSAAREVKRIDSTSRSPRYAHFKETLSGLPLIRAFEKSHWYKDQFFYYLERSQKAFVNSFLLNRWFSIRIPIIGGIISGSTALCLIYSVNEHHLSAAKAGLVTLYSMSFWGALNWGIRMLSDLESKMTSIERIQFMATLESEHKISTKPISTQLNANAWPHIGEIVFEDVHARYDEKLPDVIRDLNLKIPGGMRVGIIGRTGAGKTSIFQLLYRFMKTHHGTIKIDDVDISTVELKILRSKLAIIPQDPILFMGTFRSNLDPYGYKNNEELMEVLKIVGLSDLINSTELGLNAPILDSGSNLSQGQRQLFCLARALLIDSKIILLDEATASIDVVSDFKIQEILKKELATKTVLIIAHRLSTVSELDYVVELANGQIKSIIKSPQVM